MHLTLSTVLVYTNDDYSPLFALFVLFAIRYSPLFAVRYSRLFAVRYSLFATIRYSGFPDTLESSFSWKELSDRYQSLTFSSLDRVARGLGNRENRSWSSYNMWIEKFQAIQKKFLYYDYQNKQDCSKIVTRESWHPTYQAWRLLLARNECGLFWALVLHSDDRLSLSHYSFYPFCLKICGFVLLIRHIIAWIWPVRFPKFVKTIVLLWKPWPAVDLKISKCHKPRYRSLSRASTTRYSYLRSIQRFWSAWRLLIDI